MQNFWVLLLELSSLTGQHATTDVARLAEIKMKLKVDNEYVRHYESVVPIQLQLSSGIIVANVGVRELKKKEDKLLLIHFYDLCGICLTRAMLKNYMTEFGIPLHPSEPLPPSKPLSDPVISQQAKFNGKLVWLGFKLSNFECLSEFSLNYD
jgi:hypothetical protein